MKFPTRLSDSYSLVIQDFQSIWQEDEVTDDLQVEHILVLKLTLLVARNGKYLRAGPREYRPIYTYIGCGKILGFEFDSAI